MLILFCLFGLIVPKNATTELLAALMPPILLLLLLTHTYTGAAAGGELSARRAARGALHHQRAAGRGVHQHRHRHDARSQVPARRRQVLIAYCIFTCMLVCWGFNACVLHIGMKKYVCSRISYVLKSGCGAGETLISRNFW